jgi:ATP-dependent Lhr-like helicase
MLKYHFRNAAQTGLMVYRNFFDQQKPVRKLAWSAEVIFNVLRQHEPGHVLLREARRDTNPKSGTGTTDSHRWTQMDTDG